MAIGDYKLTTSRALRPGAYIGYVRITRPTSPTGQPRLPAYLGRGSRLALVRDLGHIRAYVEDEALNFSAAPPYIATLQHNALSDQSRAILVKSSGEPVNTTDWQFVESVTGSGNYDQVEISLTKFDGTTTYSIDYQSIDRDVLDNLKFSDLRQMIRVGDTEGQDLYTENTDYRVVTEVLGNTGTDADALIPGANNTNTTGSVSTITKTPAGAGDGAVAFNVASDYTWPYNQFYRLTITNVGAGTIDFTIEVFALSGGNDQFVGAPSHSTLTPPTATGVSDSATAYALDANYGITDGILLDFSQTTGFDAGDIFVWDGYGPAMVELSSAYDNTNQYSSVADPAETASAPTSSGNITIDSATDFTGDHDRGYVFEVSAAAGTGPNRTATIVATGYKELPNTELTFNLDETVATSLTKVAAEAGIYLDFDFGVGHAAADAADVLTSAAATDLPTALTLAGEILTNFNAHDADAVPTWHAVSGGSHQITASAPTDLATLLTFITDAGTQYSAHINDATMHTPIDDIFVLDSTIVATTLAGALSFLNDFKTKFNRHVVAVNYVVGDTWATTALAPRLDYTGKDDRSYLLTTTSIVSGTSINFSYTTGTLEGGFGTVSASPTDPYLSMQDQIELSIRNYEDTSTNRHVANDTWSFTTVDEGTVDWTLTTRATQTIDQSDVHQDILGNITGVPLAYYVILDNTPTSVMNVSDPATGDAITYSIVQSGGENTPYLVFLTDPGSDVEVYYEWRGMEPDPGNIYYISAYRLRADDEYNTPVLYLTREDMTDGLSPRTPDNHLYIAGDIAFDTDFFGAYFVQVKDQSGDGTFTLPDFKLAITATESSSQITDIVVLSYFDALAASKTSIEAMNDPFERKERLLWVGAPIGTTIGDVDTPNTLVYLARNTLQFSGDSPGRGNIILIGNTEATRTITLDDGSSTSVTLDGSFIAVAASARTAAFTDPASTLLREDVSSFDTLVTYGSKEELLLVAASILFLSDVGGGLYRFGESTTVDTSTPDLNEISAMTQKQYVTRFIRTRLDENLIAVVPPTPEAGVFTVQSELVSELQTLVSAGSIAPYGSEESPPTRRAINPSSDTYVFTDQNDKRWYHIGYFYNLRYPIKRILGLYSVDSKFWDSRSLAA